MLRTTNRFLTSFSLQIRISPSHSIQHPQHHRVPGKRAWEKSVEIEQIQNCMNIHELCLLMKLQEYSLSKIWETVFQLRGIWTFCLVGSLEVNMKILVLNCISARNFHLFLLIIQISEQPPQSADFPYYFSYLFLLLPLCRQFT